MNTLVQNGCHLLSCAFMNVDLSSENKHKDTFGVNENKVLRRVRERYVNKKVKKMYVGLAITSTKLTDKRGKAYRMQ
jgi:hypothetical protein